jgi:hypothetical protein
VLFGLLIVDENFALLTVTAWLILGSPDDCEDVLFVFWKMESISSRERYAVSG